MQGGMNAEYEIELDGVHGRPLLRAALIIINKLEDYSTREV